VAVGVGNQRIGVVYEQLVAVVEAVAVGVVVVRIEALEDAVDGGAVKELYAVVDTVPVAVDVGLVRIRLATVDAAVPVSVLARHAGSASEIARSIAEAVAVA